MPIISQFYGILVYMYKEIGGHHNEPHIHIKYNEYTMSVTIDGKVLKNYELEIVFENGERRIFDVKPYLKFKKFDELKENDMFSKVKIAGLSIEWENGADICPDELYNSSKKL